MLFELIFVFLLFMDGVGFFGFICDFYCDFSVFMFTLFLCLVIVIR